VVDRYHELESGRDEVPVTFVAVDITGDAAGGVGLAPFDPPERTDRGPWVVGTIVRADRRGNGIGTALMAHLQRWATAAGIRQLWVATGGAATPFYRTCGWTITETLHRDDGQHATILTTPPHAQFVDL
jgi:GNAT superfamily N-acetyltransferase